MFDAGETILTFWEKQKNIQPNLQKLAQVVFAVPATQVTVERSFSTLDFVFSKRRGRINEDNLENQLLVCLNRQFMDSSVL
jgi:hAT family C-terminal dimerisation region